MAGGDLRLNNRKLKVKALPQNLPDFVEADITPLNMGNKLYVTQVPPDFKIMHPDNTVICQVKISRAAMKAARSSKSSKSTCKRKEKIIFFQSYLKASVVNWCFFYLSSALSGLFQTLTFQKHKHCLPTVCPAIHFNLLSAKRLSKGFSLLSGLFYNLFTP
jgi:hypothetical protein